MQTKQKLLLEVLGQPDVQLVVPVFQRTYSWGAQQCDILLRDVQRAGKAGDAHFMGTVLCSDGAGDAGGCRRQAVVDGQQRLTTLTLLLLALKEHNEKHGDITDAAFADVDRYLLVDGANGPTGKLLLSRTDRDTLLSLVGCAEAPADPSPRVVENYERFVSALEGPDADAASVWHGLKSVQVIDAELDGADQAQLIFESLNSKGLPLTTADLVRNYLLMAENHSEQARLYNEYWEPIQGLFGDDPGSVKLNNAILGWLTVRFRKVRAKDSSEVYPVFKRYCEDEYDGTLEDLLDELRRFCLVWAENYRYHAVKKYKSADWAAGKRKTLVSDREVADAADGTKTDAKTRAARFERVDASW